MAHMVFLCLMEQILQQPLFKTIGRTPKKNGAGTFPSQPRLRTPPATPWSPTLQPSGPFGRPNVNRLFHLLPHRFLARLVEAQHGVVVHLEPPPMNLRLKHQRPRYHVIPEDDLLARPPQLQHRQQLPARHQVLLDRRVHARPKHLPDVSPWRLPRGNVVPIRLRPPLWVQR